MTALAVVAANTQVKVYDRTKTLLATFAGADLSFSHSKGPDSSVLSFTASALETGYSPDLFDDTLAVVELDAGAGFVPVSCPYLLRSSGPVVTDGARSSTVTGRSALTLANEWLVLHDQGIINRRGPTEVFFGWQHPDFDATAWIAPDRYPRTPAPTPQKDKKPDHWECDAADWVTNVWDGTGTYPGHLILFRIGSFTITGDPVKVRIASTADEEHKVYLFGPGQGGVVIDSTEQETGYEYNNRWNEVLVPGTYFVAVEMTVITTPGGDGLDALSLYVGPVDADDKVTTFYLHTGAASVKVWRQDESVPRPGLTVGKILNLLWNQFETWCPGGSTSILFRSFTNTADSAGIAWPDAQERSWTVGSTLAQVLADLSDVADFDLDTGWHLDAFTQRGSDLSATVKIVPGSAGEAADENALAYDYDVTPPTATRALIYTPSGFTTSISTSRESARQPRAVYVESQQANSLGAGKALAGRVFAERGQPVVTNTATVVALAGKVPLVDFGWGDTIAGLNRAVGVKNVQVVSISAHRPEGDDSAFLFELELT